MSTVPESSSNLRHLDLDGRRFAEMLKQVGVPEGAYRAHVQRLVDTTVPGWWGTPVGARAVQLACACIARAMRDPRIGLKLGEQRTGRTLTLGDYLVRSAPTVRAAFEVAQRYWDPRFDYVRTTLVEQGGTAVIELSAAPGLTLHPVNVDYRISRLIAGTRTLLGDARHVPHEIGFSYPRPDDLQPYYDHYGRSVRLVFDVERSRLCFASALLDAPSVHRDDMLHDLMQGEAEKLIERLRAQQTDSVARRLHDVIASQLAAGKPSTAKAARKLGLSERTLRRRLADEGESFQSIVDNVRSAMAQAYLQDGRLNADGLAERLGFDSAASLRRAFKRWTGSSLREQRAVAAAR